MSRQNNILLGVPRGYAVALLAIALWAAWRSVFAAGGTSSALPHLFYLPVVAAALRFGRTGGAIAGLAATLLCGPLMPLDVTAGIGQSTGNWLARGAFFVAVGVATGTAIRSVATDFERTLIQRLNGELLHEVPGHDSLEGAVQRIAEVIEGRHIDPVFQPIYELDTGHLVAIEALARFPERADGRGPDAWFTEAARLGMHANLEIAAAFAAVRACHSLPESVAVSINLSPATLTDPRLDTLLARFAGRRLVLELTEHTVVDDYVELLAVLGRLRGPRVDIAVDDAGAGFASLRHVLRLDPDIVKLDRSLTQDVRGDRVRHAMGSALVQFGHRTDTFVVVEGIETYADLTAWRDMGADAAQGHLLGRPGPPPTTTDPWPGISGWTPPRSGRRTRRDATPR